MADTPKKPMPSWDELAGEEKPAGMSPEMAKKLLEMNPALRDQGLSTDLIVKQKVPAAKPTAPTPPALTSGGLGEMLSQAKDELAALEQKKVEAKARALERITQWLLKNDPDMLSPMTRAVFAEQKQQLEAIGFSMKSYMDKRTKR